MNFTTNQDTKDKREKQLNALKKTLSFYGENIS